MSITLLQDITFHDDTFDFDPAALTGGGRDQTQAPLPAPGYYRMKVVAAGLATDPQTGELVRVPKDSTLPVFKLQRIAIIEPEEAAGSFPVFQDITCVGWPRRNWKTNEVIPGPKEYAFMDWLMAIDSTLATPASADDKALDLNIKALTRVLETKPTFVGRLTYEATDVTYAKAQIANGVTKKDAYKSARLNSQAFKNADGSYRTETLGPSGETVLAKLKVAEFVPDTRTVELGPLKARRR